MLHLDRCALVILDAQKGFDDLSYWSPTGRRNNPACERNAAALVDEWRANGRPVIFVRHDSDTAGSPLEPGQDGNAIKPELTGQPDLLVNGDELSLLRRTRPACLAPRPRHDRLRRLRNPDQPLRRDHSPHGRKPRLRIRPNAQDEMSLTLTAYMAANVSFMVSGRADPGQSSAGSAVSSQPASPVLTVPFGSISRT